MYDVYIDKILLPVAPKKIDTKIKNQNKTINLINEGEVNVLKLQGLITISFTFLVPHTNYPFASYKNGFFGIDYFLNELKKLKDNDEPFQFIVVRRSDLFNTNITVSIEDYTIKEDAKNGLDIEISIELKQYKSYGTKIISKEDVSLIPVKQRETKNSPSPKKAMTYTVKKGDCLWNIAKQFYGNGTKYPNIATANKDIIKQPNLIHPGDVLTIPPLTGD